ncbi:MAG: NAD-binding protein [Anaerolineaceae bacterium]|nr:NAD-binding protein [Anaerolineaceae bacterium]
MMNVMIIGGGKVGIYLASYLIKEGHDVRMIEQRAEELPQITRDVPKQNVSIGNGTDPDVLEQAGIRKAQVIAAVTGTDEVNLIITSLARLQFSVPRTIARINHPKNAWMFNANMGVDVALNQADLMARLIAEEMSLGDMMTLHLMRKGHFQLVEEKVHPQSPAFGKKLSDLHLPDQSTIAALIRDGKMIAPRGDTVFHEADEVIAVVHQSQKKDLAKFFDHPAL